MRLALIIRNPATAEGDVVEGEGEDYATARRVAIAKIPDGWKALSIRQL
jgi:hypothetical protein